MISYFLPFPKLSAKNIYYCGHKVGKNDMADMVSNEVPHDLNTMLDP